MSNALTTLSLFRLDRACEPIQQAYGHPPYLVGTAIDRVRPHRDVDVRLILPDDEFDRHFPTKAIWQVVCLGIAAWLESSTGLDIDFQAQKQSVANEKFGGPRNPLGLGADIRSYAGGGDATDWPNR